MALTIAIDNALTVEHRDLAGRDAWHYAKTPSQAVERTSGPRKVTEAQLVVFARLYDPQYFHVDPQAAQRSVFAELVASGILHDGDLAAARPRDSPPHRWICVSLDRMRVPPWPRGPAIPCGKRAQNASAAARRTPAPVGS